MGMHQPGWRERNEERAWEEWDTEVAHLLAEMRGYCDQISQAVRTMRRDAVGTVIHDALQAENDAAERLWAIRHGPENPDH